ncbi:MAG: cell surface protein SprA [Tannerella sp.]|jgi:cell surface protein SprA|nr:cell surface protein SprA [Tannerella sp.]
MKRRGKYIIIVVIFISGIFALNAEYVGVAGIVQYSESLSSESFSSDNLTSGNLTSDTIPSDSISEDIVAKSRILIDSIPGDTVIKPRIPVKKTVPEEYEDLKGNSAADLRDPENLKTEVEYDLKTGTYLIKSVVGDMKLGTPLMMTPEEYQKYSLKQSINQYFREKNRAAWDSISGGGGPGGKGDKRFDPMNIQFDLGPAEKIFGPGGVRLRSQGTIGLDVGLKSSSTNNPSLPEKSRSRTFFNFDTDVQANMVASVGNKVNFDFNYNTGAAFEFDAAKLNLNYAGDEDEIVKALEGGNVSLQTNNSLIRGGSALFGVKTDLQFGKLRIKAIVAQQESDSRSISSKGGSQMTNYEITADNYDESRHYFFSHYFRDNYDKALSKLPYISSGIMINRIEVWITNKSSIHGQTRNIVAFADLGENSHISNPMFTPAGNLPVPYNNANSLYGAVVANYPGAREISTVTQTFDGVIEGGRDYEKVESARMLSASDYNFNQQLGYISLTAKLQNDEVLAVAFEYIYNGTVYQVGEFSSDKTEDTNKCLYLKLLKGTSLSPSMPFWDLMMKNIYAIPGAYMVSKEKFRLDIVYHSDTAGTYVYTIPEGEIKEKPLLKVMNLDRLNSNNEVVPNSQGDGFFDFVEGYTVTAVNGRIIFPVVEPFGQHLRKAIGNDAVADKYVYQELYDSTLTIAKQIAEKNKFVIRGQYSGSSSSSTVLKLGATNVARGSVVVQANGIVLTENVDYQVNYTSGTVTILNETLISSNANISVSLENQSTSSMQRKSVFGTDINYEISKDLNVGTTIMHLSEVPQTTKMSFGEESVKNTLWGLNLDYKSQSQWLTNMVDKLPLLSVTAPSTFSLNAEFAHLIAGHYQSKYVGEYSYLDDFESTQSEFDLLNPYFWNISSTPYDGGKEMAQFPEAILSNNIDYGKNRALLAWYYIDGLFTRRNSSLRPSYMTDDDLSDHRVRAVLSEELFPNRDLLYNENNYLNILNLAYYPKERGPYNLDADNINIDGTLANPEKRWGGIMRSLDQTDFEAANIQYIEFWVMDPFIYNPNQKGGDLYFNLGEVSEDILKDEKKFFENGMPANGDLLLVDTTVWGRVPKQQSTVYAFDNTAGARALQDVGFNGLSSVEEQMFPTYQSYIEKLRSRLSPETLSSMENDPFSPLNDPAGDDFSYFRSYDHDSKQTDILTRYKHYNGVEGNSKESGETRESYGTSSKMVPDVEDFNQDNTLNENEKYYQYRVSMRPKDMVVGANYIVDKRITNVRLANGTREDVTWYQFKVPVRDYTNNIGSMTDFSSIRFMRMYMTDFEESTVLRFGKFALIRGEWRPYQQNLAKQGSMPSVAGTIAVASVNIEENSDREPVNYMLPPGVTRITDPNQPQLRQQNEQSLSLKINNLASQDARAVYKTTSYDLRRYKRMQLFVHAEKLVDDVTSLENSDLSVFIRLGSDYKNNFYEYEVPLTLTPFGTRDREQIWPADNMLNFGFEALTELKLRRNRAKSAGENGVNYNTFYTEYDPDNTRNSISVVGNPSLSDVQVIMIGVRNNSKDIKSAEVWINELRVTDFDESGGWAANANANLAIADFATVNAMGNIETAGFGSIEQSVSERSLDDHSRFSIATTLQLGKLLPDKLGMSLPLYYSYSQETLSPQYNPLDQDILLQKSIDNELTKTGKDSIRSFSYDTYTTKALALNNVHVNIKSKTPMPYDPANITMGFASNTEKRTNPETTYETTNHFQGNLGYAYTPFVKPLKPFTKLKTNNGYTKYAKQMAFYYLPSSISFQNNITRNYYELQLRDLNDLGSGVNNIPVSFSQNFLWDRALDLRWNPLPNIMVEFSSNTNARIEEANLQVNREMNPDAYERWKDTVMQSIADMGTPLLYDQKMSIRYMPPFQQIPVLDWVSGTVTYTTTYNWEKGAFVDEETNIGNSIKNRREIDFTGKLTLLTLYNKNDFLKKVIQKGNIRPPAPARDAKGKVTKPAAVQKKPEKKTLEVEIKLNPDSGVIVQHNMLTKKVLISARRTSDSSSYKVKYTAIDYARIRITNKDTISLKLKVRPAPQQDETFAYKLAEHTARTLMMLRSVSLTYNISDGMYLPGFMPGIANWFGQGATSAGRAPGWGFAFGDVRRDYISEAADKKWLVYNPDNITPAMINSFKHLSGNTQLEPLKGLKIALNIDYMDSRDTQIQFMSQGMPETRTGNFSMTTVGLGGFFAGSGDSRKAYKSDVFSKMLDFRTIIAERISGRYSGSRYPNSGFLAGTVYPSLDGYKPELGSVGVNSSDVLIPAFLAAYTNKKAEKVGLTAFPSMGSVLPNWKVTYDGLTQIPYFAARFKAFNFTHNYSCIYNVGNYTSYLNWVNAGIGGDLGYISNTETGAPIPSMGYEIASVSMVEQFSPLLGVDATMLNDVTVGTKYSKMRTINMNVTSYQMVEIFKDDITLSLGYKYPEFNKVLGLKKKKNSDFNNDLTVRMDYTYSKNLSLIRKIEEDYTQATQGSLSHRVNFSADYAFSKKVTLRAFYDLQINEPLVSSSAYPTTNANYGLSIQVSLDQ